MKRICKLFALLLVLALALTACGSAAGDDDGGDQQTGDQTAAETPMLELGSGLSLMSASRYAGAFVEDGSDDTVADVMAITVRNDGYPTVSDAHITLTLGESAYDFDVTTLPAGASAQLLELARQTMPDSMEGVSAEVSACALFDAEPTLCPDALTIETQDTAITVTNTTDSDMGQIYVYYKIAYGELYLGGITYRVGVSGLKAGETTTCYAGHFFTDYSKLMFATYVQ